MMCKLVCFSYIQGYYSLRDMAKACITDIRFHILTSGHTPSHQTFGEFINRRLGKNTKELFKRVMLAIKEVEDVDMSISFIDGTKLQANANKYTFVWKRTVMKYLANLHNKITTAIEELNTYSIPTYLTEFDTKEKYQPEDIITIMNWLMTHAKQEKVELKGKSDKGKHPLQRHYHTFIEYEVKMMEYLEKIEICGESRNSFSKTDPDATFLHLKEDYYGGTNLFHATYNIQIMVSDEYITHVGIYDRLADYKTFIPMMESYHEMYEEYPMKPVVDAGYGGYDNYMYCMEKEMELVQKFNGYSNEKGSKYKKQIFRKENWYRDEETGDYICPNFKRFEYKKEIKTIEGDTYKSIIFIHVEMNVRFVQCIKNVQVRYTGEV